MKPTFQKLSVDSKIAKKGGFSFSTVIGIVSMISTISMIIPPIANMFIPKKQAPRPRKIKNDLIGKYQEPRNSDSSTIIFS